ncbi:MAG: HlyC/CorC family transporter [Gammaproteobacteria bacterium]|nr:HlyC/CorC family transporter [Gammaproteobacteria bacterium]MDH3411831.1 HlyC/CorC family transporter [Gammaproteobacteria bacterium]
MIDIPLSALALALVFLILLSAFFSGSETGMMALNRYRLRHLARHKHRGAMRVSRLLERPDRLIGLILLGNNLVNNLAAALVSLMALKLFGEAAVAIAVVILTIVMLIFAETAPKTLAALHPERVAFPAAYVLGPLLRVLYPIVAAINWLAGGVLRLLRVAPDAVDRDSLSSDELRTVVNEAGAMISRRYQKMLVSILDLEKVAVDDIMVPRSEINGVDLDDPTDEIIEQLMHSQHTRLPIFRGDINNIVGVLHLRKVLKHVNRGKINKADLVHNAQEPYFVPGGTPLSTQLRNFQRQGERVGLIVDEYGDIEGLVTIEDLLEEIVGEFTTDPADQSPDVHPQPDGTYLVDGTANLRELNRSMHWELPTNGPRTINGLVLEHLETIPEPGTSLLIAGYPVEIVHVTSSAVKTARIKPAQRRGVKRRSRAGG